MRWAWHKKTGCLPHAVDLDQSTLTEEQCQQLEALLYEYANVVMLSSSELGSTELLTTQLIIHTSNSKPEEHLSLCDLIDEGRFSSRLTHHRAHCWKVAGAQPKGHHQKLVESRLCCKHCLCFNLGCIMTCQYPNAKSRVVKTLVLDSRSKVSSLCHWGGSWMGMVLTDLAWDSCVVYIDDILVIEETSWETSENATVCCWLVPEATEMLLRKNCIEWWYIHRQYQGWCSHRISTTFRPENTAVLSGPGFLLMLFYTQILSSHQSPACPHLQ